MKMFILVIIGKQMASENLKTKKPEIKKVLKYENGSKPTIFEEKCPHKTEIVRLNVGGIKYITTNNTLRIYQGPLSMLVDTEIGKLVDSDGYIFIDRNGELFEHILEFLRTMNIFIGDDPIMTARLLVESEYYCIVPLIKLLTNNLADMQRAEIQELESKYSNTEIQESCGGESRANNESKIKSDVVCFNVNGNIRYVDLETLGLCGDIRNIHHGFITHVYNHFTNKLTCNAWEHQYPSYRIKIDHKGRVFIYDDVRNFDVVIAYLKEKYGSGYTPVAMKKMNCDETKRATSMFYLGDDKRY